MFRKRVSRPKKNNISRTRGHRAHTRTKGKTGRGGVGRRDWLLRSPNWAASLNAFPICSPQGPLQALHFARSYFVAPFLFSIPPSSSKLERRGRDWLLRSLWAAPLNAFPFCSPQGPLQALHSARSYFVAPPFVLTPINTSKLADGCKNKKRCLSTSSCFVWSCGEGGIRTPGASQLNGFQDRRNRPLCHLSKGQKYGKDFKPPNKFRNIFLYFFGVRR